MNITREDMPGRQVALIIDLDMETVNAALDKAYRQMVNQVNVPGFRRGKAPRYILENFVGKETLTERAVRNILPDTVQNAIKEQDINAMDVGDVEIVSMNPVQVKVIIVQPPKVELGDYGSIRIEKEPVETTAENVDDVMLELRREGAPWNEPAEPRPIAKGDMVYLDLEGFTTQGPLEEAARENFPTIVGLSRAGVPAVVNNALVGMAVGEEKDVTDTLPEDYPTEALRGLDVTYHVTVRSMKEQILPELDDEFAKKAGYDTVEALRQAVDENLRRRADENAATKQLDSAIEQLVTGAEIEVPELMVNEELDSMLKTLENRLKESRITTRQYFTYNGSSEAEWRKASRERALERVKTTQAMAEFARREDITVSQDELDAEINTILGRFEGKEREDAEQVLGSEEARHDLEDRLYQNKIVERLVGIAEGRIEAAKPEAEAEAEAATATDTETSSSAETVEPQEGAEGEADEGGKAETEAGMEQEQEAES